MKLTTSVCSVFNKATTCKKSLGMDIDTVDRPDGVVGYQKVEEKVKEEEEERNCIVLPPPRFEVELPNLMLDY